MGVKGEGGDIGIAWLTIILQTLAPITTSPSSPTMSSSILPGTPQAALLQSEVHRELIRRGYVEAADENDTTMAEYVAVMLINRKSPEQIEAELTDLLGGEFDSSFTPWLYKRLEDVSSGALAPHPAAADADDVDMRDTSRSSRPANGSARLLSTALGPLANQPAAPRGTKRSASPPGVGEGKRRSVGNERNGGGPPTGPRRAGRGVELLGRIGGHSSRYGMNAEAPEFRGMRARGPGEGARSSAGGFGLTSSPRLSTTTRRL